MFRIRFHGRGGQGIKTASRILGTAFFHEGFEVQDAPRYGAERRGAPIFAYVRASQKAIYERGIIRRPDLIVVSDESLIPSPAADVLPGAGKHTVILIQSNEKSETWKERLNFPGLVVILPIHGEVDEQARIPLSGAACSGAAARLAGVILRDSIRQAVLEELGELGESVIKKNLDKALESYDLMADHAGCVTEGTFLSAETYDSPDWVDLPFEDAGISAPAIHAAATSVEVKTGLWRTIRPVIDYDRCKRCWWVCSTFCPDSVISINNEGYPQIDYDHCKGCMICMARCPRHAIEPVPERAAQAKGGRP